MDNEVNRFIDFLIGKTYSIDYPFEQKLNDIQKYIDEELQWIDFETEEKELITEVLVSVLVKVGIKLEDVII